MDNRVTIEYNYYHIDEIVFFDYIDMCPVSSYRKIASTTRQSFEKLLAMADSELETIFMPPKNALNDDGRKQELERMMPEIIKRLNRKHANVQFVFEEYYHKECRGGYGYTQFKKHVSSYREKNDYSYHNVYEPGEEWQIDFAGCGKSYLACALGHQACTLGLKTLYLNMNRFVDVLKQSRLDGTFSLMLSRIVKDDKIVLDDFGLQKMDSDTRIALLTLLEERYEKKSMIIISQLPLDKWYDYIAEATLADAIMDRLINSSHHLNLEEPSLRKRKNK